MIRCCRNCVAPKRYPGCHGQCPEYIAEKEQHDALMEQERQKSKVRNDIYNQRATRVTKALRKHGRI